MNGMEKDTGQNVHMFVLCDSYYSQNIPLDLFGLVTGNTGRVSKVEGSIKRYKLLLFGKQQSGIIEAEVHIECIPG